MIADNTEIFTLSKTKKLKGARRLAREKALQILMAYEITSTAWTTLFSHIFFREFNFGDDEEIQVRLLTPDEVHELDSDIPIIWEDDEILFARDLIEKTVESREYIDSLISEFAQHWEFDRIASVDRILMEIAVTELLHFPEIPPKVSINEAIDIAKKYSTPKSGMFINGVLDSVHEKLKNQNSINKTGRGLIE